MKNVTKENFTQAILGTLPDDNNPRHREILASLIQHLHQFVRDVSLTTEEWATAMDGLYRAGEISTPLRSEFILMSDLLGLSTLVDLINDTDPGATETSALGPFFVENAPMLKPGGDMIEKNEGVQGIVRRGVEISPARYNPRHREILASLIQHLHQFVRDVSLTTEEWATAMDGLYRAGEISTPLRSEFILMSDLLGLSTLVDLINDTDPGATETSALGPFFVENAPMLKPGGDMIEKNEGVQGIVRGHVLTTNGKPIPGAMLEIWQTGNNGLYENVDPNQPESNLRRRMQTGPEGNYAFTTIQPISYRVPDDGAGWELLQMMGRNPWRPAHLHFRISADGFRPLITELYVEEDPYIDEDVVFGVRESLAVSFAPNSSQEDADQFNLKAPFWQVEFDFKLQTA